MTGAAPLLEARQLRCGYDGQEILHGLSLTVRPHEKLCILGPNGCGKTTLLRALAGMLPLTDGRVLARGADGPLDVRRAPRPAVARCLALMCQQPSLAFSYTVYETVQLSRFAHRQGLLSGPDAADRAAVEESLRRTGLWQLRSRPITALSGGQLQRVFLARTLAQQPRIILLDEPTSHLDLKYQLELTEYLREWAAEEEHCVVGVLHDLNLALRFADTLLLLKDGRIMAQGSAAGFDLTALDALFGLDVGGYMRGALARWQQRAD